MFEVHTKKIEESNFPLLRREGIPAKINLLSVAG